MNSYKDVCNFIIGYCKTIGRDITNLQLQKILYYVQGYSLRNTGQRAFESDIEAWQFGPVVPDAYYDYCGNGRDPITVDNADEAMKNVSMSDRSTIESIVDRCVGMSIGNLIEETHREEPWANAFTGYKSPISIDSIKDFFEKNDPLNIGQGSL